MRVRDIIKRALYFIAREDLAPLLEGGVFDDEDAAKEGEETLKTLLYCFNSVEDELARKYFDLKTIETMSDDGGVYSFDNFMKTPLKILSVKSDGKEIKYSISPHRLVCDATDITVEYTYTPDKKELNGKSEFGLGEPQERLIAAGTASEFCLINGEYHQAELWESVYRKEIDEFQRRKFAGAYFAPRRWV